MRILVFLIAALAVLVPATRAAEPFFKPGDVVALVGGEDMVVAAELGYLETLIQLALPDHKLKFRSLAREGDTVFEQRRDLNYPKLEDQLDKMGATVVICQFGQMESLAGKEKVGEFVAAYEKLIGRLKGKDGARRVVIVNPPMFGHVVRGHAMFGTDALRQSLYSELAELAKRVGAAHANKDLIMICSILPEVILSKSDRMGNVAHIEQAAVICSAFAGKGRASPHGPVPSLQSDKALVPLRDLIAAKNRLWFHYYRPQNWAFLAGDRTNQPSSRDHIDRNKRWFPEELEKFVPLIDAKDAEIWALAKKLAK